MLIICIAYITMLILHPSLALISIVSIPLVILIPRRVIFVVLESLSLSKSESFSLDRRQDRTDICGGFNYLMLLIISFYSLDPFMFS